MIPDPNDRATITVVEAAEALGICRSTAYRAVAEGELPAIRVAGRILVPVAALRALLRLEPTPAAEIGAVGTRGVCEPQLVVEPGPTRSHTSHDGRTGAVTSTHSQTKENLE